MCVRESVCEREEKRILCGKERDREGEGEGEGERDRERDINAEHTDAEDETLTSRTQLPLLITIDLTSESFSTMHMKVSNRHFHRKVFFLFSDFPQNFFSFLRFFFSLFSDFPQKSACHSIFRGKQL